MNNLTQVVHNSFFIVGIHHYPSINVTLIDIHRYHSYKKNRPIRLYKEYK